MTQEEFVWQTNQVNPIPIRPAISRATQASNSRIRGSNNRGKAARAIRGNNSKTRANSRPGNSLAKERNSNLARSVEDQSARLHAGRLTVEPEEKSVCLARDSMPASVNAEARRVASEPSATPATKARHHGRGRSVQAVIA